MKTLLLTGLMATTLVGCMTIPPAPPAGSIPVHMYGAKPDVEKRIKWYYEARLKDPESARYAFSETVPCYLREAPVHGGKISRYGWCVIAGVNAKNSYGGYVGMKYERFFINERELFEFNFNPWFQEPWYRDGWYPYANR